MSRLSESYLSIYPGESDSPVAGGGLSFVLIVPLVADPISTTGPALRARHKGGLTGSDSWAFDHNRVRSDEP